MLSHARRSAARTALTLPARFGAAQRPDRRLDSAVAGAHAFHCAERQLLEPSDPVPTSSTARAADHRLRFDAVVS